MFDNIPLVEKELAYCKLGVAWGPNERNKGGFIIQYGANGFGFGTVTFVIKEDGSLYCDNELLDRKTIKYILSNLVDRAEFQDGKEDELKSLKNNNPHGEGLY